MILGSFDYVWGRGPNEPRGDIGNSSGLYITESLYVTPFILHIGSYSGPYRTSKLLQFQSRF